MAELLRMENISKRFGSFYANKNVTFDVQEGEVHTLLGENGAGKSTLMNVLIGLYQPTEGKIFMHGKEVSISSPRVAVEQGIGMVHQHFMLIDDMTGLENIILGDKRHNSPLLQEGEDRKTVEDIMDRYGLEIDLDEKVGDMSIGMQQRVEIMKVLFRGADLLVLDEPTAVLTDLEVEGLFDIMRSLTAEGKGIVFISHKMREVMRISDRVTVLRRGETVETVRVADTTEQELADLMIGQKFVENTYEKVSNATKDEFVLQNVSYHPEIKHGGLKDVSLTIHKGEILGVAGIDGNGQTPLAEVVTGLVKPDSGKVIGPDGNEIAVFSPETFIDAGLGNIPEDRNKMGLVGDMTIAENLVLKQTGALAGVVAGLMTNTGQIGFIGGMRLPTTLTKYAAYLAAAQKVNPQVEGHYNFDAGFTDASFGTNITNQWIASNNVDVMWGDASAVDNGARQALEEAGVDTHFDIAQPIDSVGADNPSVITSTVTDWMFGQAMDEVEAGSFGNGAVIEANMDNGGVYLGSYSDKVSQEVQDKVAEYTEQIKGGTFLTDDEVDAVKATL